jgi:dTMP kinase
MIINLTGIDGCGKGTQITLLAQHFMQAGKRTFISKAYGDAEKETLSMFVRKWHQTSILFMFQALHVQQRIEAFEAEERGELVISDRWDDSYHAYHRNFGILKDDLELREQLNKIAFEERLPDITFFLDTPLEVAQRRMDDRGRDFFDQHPLSYHQYMQEGYRTLAKERGWITINSEESVEKIHNEILSHLPF